MSLETPIPIPRPETNTVEERRLWIGNLDHRVTEFQLLKLLQHYGPIEKFDLLFHRSGPLIGRPRGYGFVTFQQKEDARAMKEAIDGTRLGSKCISVRWAYIGEDVKKQQFEAIIPALGVKKEKDKKMSKQMQIQAIETKLKLMEQSGGEEFSLSSTGGNQPSQPQRLDTAKRPAKPATSHNAKCPRLRHF